MSRRNQSRRRRTYGRRQHEVRERRGVADAPLDWVNDESAPHDGWLMDAADDSATGFGDANAGYAR